MRKFHVVKMIVFVLAGFAVMGYALMWLWNGLIPELFKGSVISFPQAVGLLILSKILLPGWGWRGSHRWKGSHWRERMQQKMDAMTPEERDAFRKQWQDRCGRYGKWRHESQGEAGSKTSA